MNTNAGLNHIQLINPDICPLCNSSRDRWLLNAKTFGSGPYARHLFSIYTCQECKIGITDPVPSEAESHLLYESRASLDFQPSDSAIAAALKAAACTFDVRTFVGGVNLRKPALKMLDYACGNGAFAVAMQRVYPDSTVWATDYHPEVPPMLLRSGVCYVPYKDLSGQGDFDFILCRHVLEHTYAPVKFLQGIRRLLSPSGVLMIEVPNLRAPLKRVFGKYWDGNYAPYHPVHFSVAALRRAVAEAGFAAERVRYSEMPKVGRSLRNIANCDYNPALFIIGMLLQPVQIGAKVLNQQGTCLRLWARKT